MAPSSRRRSLSTPRTMKGRSGTSASIRRSTRTANSSRRRPGLPALDERTAGHQDVRRSHRPTRRPTIRAGHRRSSGPTSAGSTKPASRTASRVAATWMSSASRSRVTARRGPSSSSRTLVESVRSGSGWRGKADSREELALKSMATLHGSKLGEDPGAGASRSPRHGTPTDDQRGRVARPDRTRCSRRAYGRVIRTSSTAASTIEPAPPSVATNTIRIVCPAHGASEIDADDQLGPSTFAAPVSPRTRIRVPSASSTNASNRSAELEFEPCAK